ncbi:MAG: SET domain-containing protein [Bacteroidota bacterium]
MKKLFLLFLFSCFTGLVYSQAIVNYTMKFRYQNKDTLLSREKIHFWSKSGQFPAYIDWENAPFAIQPSAINGVGLFTDSSGSYTAGLDIGWAFIKVAGTGVFIDDYYESNIGMFVNDSQTPNAEIINTTQGLMMRAITTIGPNTEITASYQQILDLFPNDDTVKFLIKYW